MVHCESSRESSIVLSAIDRMLKTPLSKVQAHFSDPRSHQLPVAFRGDSVLLPLRHMTPDFFSTRPNLGATK